MSLSSDSKHMAWEWGRFHPLSPGVGAFLRLKPLGARCAPLQAEFSSKLRFVFCQLPDS